MLKRHPWINEQWICYSIPEKSFPSCNKKIDLFPVPLCYFFFVLLLSLASFFRSTPSVLAVNLSVVFEPPQKMIYLITFFFFFDDFSFSLFHHFIKFRIIFFVLVKRPSLHLIAMTRMAKVLALILRNMVFSILNISNAELCN